MEETCDLLNDFDLFHCLFKPLSEQTAKVKERLSFAPDDYLKWCNVCAGGDLQVCELLGEDGLDKDTGLKFSTFEEYEKEGKDAGLSEEYYIFAVSNFGDYFCFKKTTDGTKDNGVYQWGLHEGEIVLIWDNFADWFDEQVKSWVDMIADDELDAIPAKLMD